MDQQGIEIVEEDTTFNLRKLGLSSELVDELNSGIAPEEDVMNNVDEHELLAQQSSEDESEEEDDNKANEQALDRLYAEYLSRNTKKGTIDLSRTQQKRTKIAKRALAEQAVVEDMSLYDGNDTQYKKLLQVEVVRTCFFSLILKSDLLVFPGVLFVVSFYLHASLQLSIQGQINLFTKRKDDFYVDELFS